MFLKSWHTGIFVENPINMLLSLTFARGRVFPLWKQVNSGKTSLFMNCYLHMHIFMSFCFFFPTTRQASNKLARKVKVFKGLAEEKSHLLI